VFFSFSFELGPKSADVLLSRVSKLQSLF